MQAMRLATGPSATLSHRSQSGNAPQVLVVDDEPDMVELLTVNLRHAGFEVATAGDGTAALRQVHMRMPDLVLLDLRLPGMSGLEVCQQLRSDPATARLPIIIVSGRTTENDRVLGLELGADDYVTKPFSPRELVLRSKILLRRNAPPADCIHAGELVVDLARHRVTVSGRTLELTATEFRLLSGLAQRPGCVLTREELLREAWNNGAFESTRTVDTHVRRLRRKLSAHASDPIETVRGVGYRYAEA